ncbi:MAG: hypothetical protein SFX72_15120 [Isosphaeraceae bacterium]|nr:hypothetical protein [Isosphaeraceae bacterium]
MSSRPDREQLERRGRGIASVVALGLLASSILPSPAPAADPPRNPLSPIYHNSRKFRIPFNIDPAERDRIREVLLVVSEDLGRNWKPISRTTPDKPALAFLAPRDGEYWFAVQTVDDQGRFYPPKSEEIRPRMKVIVDTMPPAISLEPSGRRGRIASVRWEIRDEAIDLDSLILEYQAVGARDWRRIPIRRPMLLGQESWDAGTAEEIRVRASVLDRAKNSKDVVIDLPDGTPSSPTPGDIERSDGRPSPSSSFASGESDGLPQFPSRPAAPAAPAAVASDFPAPAASGNGFDPFSGRPRGAASESGSAARRDANPAARRLLVPSPKFALQYAVDDAAPGGPAAVELWVTQDGGRSWSRRGDDPDRASPIAVDLGSEGTFGVKLVALSAANQGDQPPVAGEPPQLIVEVDTTPPVVRLDPVQVGVGPNLGKVAILWNASDLHLAAGSVTISVRPDAPGSAWAPIGPPVDNSGQFIWTLPGNTPPRFHLKVEVADEAGNVGSDETPEGSPVLVDRSKPKSRIIGLDPSVRSGARPGNAFR